MIEAPVVPDAQAVLLLCSTLGLAREGKPLTPSEWNSVATALERAGLRPGDLLGRSVDEIARALGIPAATATRMVELLARGGQLALELERLQARGIWVHTRVEAEYPKRLKERLKGQAPIVICGAGPMPVADGPAVAIIGSRDVDERGLAFTRQLGAACASGGIAVVSGGARGVDLTAQDAALDAGGTVQAVLADSLEKALQKRTVREAVRRGSLTLMTTVHPAAGFSSGIAMGRNKVVYALSTAAVVVSSSEGSGGTWAGATENLTRGWVPLFVRQGDGVPAGNGSLLAAGASPLAEGHEAIGAFVTELAPARHEVPPVDTAVSVAGLAESPPPYAAPPDSAPEPPSPEKTAPPTPVTSSGPSDVYALVAERIRAFCETPQSAKDVQAQFGLVPAQAKTWLARAVTEGVLIKVKRTKYQAAARSLFDS